MIIEDVLGVFRSGSEKGSVTESRTGNRKRQDSQLRGAA
jgi:hypothetical protein